MSNTPKILVTGASGTVGTALVGELKNLEPRLAFHTAVKAEKAKTEGHDTVLVDFAFPETLKPALEGVDAVFLLGTGGLGQEQGEIAVVAAAKEVGVKKVVKLSMWSAEAEANTFTRIHRAVERFIESSGLIFTFLRPNGFMQNFVSYMADGIRTQGMIYLPAGAAKISHVDVRDLARVAAIALTSSLHEGKAYELSGPAALSYGDAAEVLSRVLGKQVRYVAVNDDAAKAAMVSAHMPAFYADYLVELYQYYRTGAGSPVSRAVEEITGRAPVAFEQFVRDHVSAF
ncbi:MAG TPA: NmrA family NAD(P)-binding protein [Polyangiaceae bacterium]|nr:NmrA family NAD(P)-binding protein [Polyangiaceae bacterium]